LSFTQNAIIDFDRNEIARRAVNLHQLSRILSALTTIGASFLEIDDGHSKEQGFPTGF